MLKVSIIIPTYNRKELFEAALKSALAQDYENKEIIISVERRYARACAKLRR